MRGSVYTKPTMSLLNLTVQQLRKAANLKDKIAALEKQLASLSSSSGIPAPFKSKKNGMSAAGRAKIAAAQKARWAKVKAAKTKPAVKAVVKAVAKPAAKPVQKPAKRKFVMSAAAKAKISAAAKARWAAKKAGEKK
jgi:hypothetical protein